MKTTINVIDENGNIEKDAISFVNKYDREYNMVTLWLTLHKMSGGIMDEDARRKCATMVKKSEISGALMFDHEGKTYYCPNK